MPARSTHRHIATGVREIERAISPSGAPVIGLYLFMAYGRLLRSMGRADLQRIVRLIPLHEQSLFGRLSAGERKSLYRVLGRLIDGVADPQEN